jgi:hypothetical protein
MKPAPNHTRLLFAMLVLLLIAAGQIQSRLLPATSLPAISPAVVVSQVYGGGGNGGSTFRNDFIELFNFSNATVDISNWSVQYASASGTSWQVTNLCASGNTCAIAPGRYYLIQEAQGAGGTTNLPSPDVTGGIAMSASAGKVALVSSTVALSGGCPIVGAMIDLVGYGATTCFEGTAAAPAPGNSTRTRTIPISSLGRLTRETLRPLRPVVVLALRRARRPRLRRPRVVASSVGRLRPAPTQMPFKSVPFLSPRRLRP